MGKLPVEGFSICPFLRVLEDGKSSLESVPSVHFRAFLSKVWESCQLEEVPSVHSRALEYGKSLLEGISSVHFRAFSVLNASPIPPKIEVA